MDVFIKVIKKDTRVQKKINIMLDRYMGLLYDFQSKTGYNSLIQNVILKQLINIMVMTINDLDIELKRKISRIKCLENRILYYKRWTVIYVLLK